MLEPAKKLLDAMLNTGHVPSARPVLRHNAKGEPIMASRRTTVVGGIPRRTRVTCLSVQATSAA